jgi:hypothetical protein
MVKVFGALGVGGSSRGGRAVRNSAGRFEPKKREGGDGVWARSARGQERSGEEGAADWVRGGAAAGAGDHNT